MIKLMDVNEDNWMDVVRLSISEEQQRFLDRPMGIIARGYVYRSQDARVIGIANDGRIIGAALVKNLDAAPACYDLQQFMVGEQYQNKGYGTEALRLIVSLLCKERKYDGVEVCVDKDNTPALRLYEKVGFQDTGYTDEQLPDCKNLKYYFEKSNPCHAESYSDVLISDFSDPAFQNAFKKYFAELNIFVQNWEDVFKEMNDGEKNLAFVRMAGDGTVIGFILFQQIKFTSWFFEETCGFIREFWIAEEFRKKGCGSELLSLAETYCSDRGIYTAMLTTDTAENFYLKQGYVKACGCRAKNKDGVFIKRLE